MQICPLACFYAFNFFFQMKKVKILLELDRSLIFSDGRKKESLTINTSAAPDARNGDEFAKENRLIYFI